MLRPRAALAVSLGWFAAQLAIGGLYWWSPEIPAGRRVLWANAGPVGISAGDIMSVDTEIESVLGVLQQAEARGLCVNVSYVS